MIAKFGKSQQYIYPVHTPDQKNFPQYREKREKILMLKVVK